MKDAYASISYLGPCGTYCHEAARIFAQRIELPSNSLTPCSSFDEVFSNVDGRKTEFGAVAMENSLEGPVTASLDNFAFKSTATILGEEVLDIHHGLLLAPKSDLSTIRTVASHPQGLAQCRSYLTKYLPGRRTLITSSTAESARLAAKDPSLAGIGSPFAAQLYHASVYARNIEDNHGNQTSFVLIAHRDHPPVLKAETLKTSLALFLRADKAGALLMILSEFAYAGINLTKIQSRPTKEALGEYMFFIDLEGCTEDPAIQTALDCLSLKLRKVKVLGSYPVSKTHRN